MSTDLLKFHLFIDGEWVQGTDGESFPVINPATGKVVAEVDKAGKDDVDKAVRSARRTFEAGSWSDMPPRKRADVLFAIAQKMAERAQELVYLECISSGGTVRRISSFDIMAAADVFNTMANFSLEYQYTEYLPVPAYPGPAHGLLWREPVGVCAAIVPWNFPLLLACWKIAPALATGNSVVVKPASNTPLTALVLAEIMAQCGVPPGVVNVVPGPGASAGELLVTHPEVDKIAFTGSTEVGRRVMQLSSGSVKKVTLELGGKSPAILLDDADLSIAVPGSLFAFLLHSGQICASGTRLFVPDLLYDQVVELLAANAAKIVVGNPLDPSTGMGPVVSSQQMETVLSYIQSGREQGARLVCGGRRATVTGCENGYFVEPTIFADATNDMRIAREEIFGPVLTVIRYTDVDQAIEMANDSIYGLAAGVWSRNVNRAFRVARKLKAGTVWINDWHLLRSDAPFGGYKQSGVGRELGRRALDEYTQVKHVHTSLVPDLERRSWLQLLFS